MATDRQIKRLMLAISGQESNGNPEAVNVDTGAYGTYQIMPENWSSWAQEAGLSADAERTAENQNIVAYHKLGQYIDEFGERGASIAWYAGPGANSYSQEALNRPQYSGNNQYPSINQYANEVMNRLNKINGEIPKLEGDIPEITTAGPEAPKPPTVLPDGQAVTYETTNNNPYAINVPKNLGQVVTPRFAEDTATTVVKQASIADAIGNGLSNNYLYGAYNVLSTVGVENIGQIPEYMQRARSFHKEDYQDNEYIKKAEDIIKSMQMNDGSNPYGDLVWRYADSPETAWKLAMAKREEFDRDMRVHFSGSGVVRAMQTASFIAGQVLDPLVLLPPLKIARIGIMANKVINGVLKGAQFATHTYLGNQFSPNKQNVALSALAGGIVGAYGGEIYNSINKGANFLRQRIEAFTNAPLTVGKGVAMFAGKTALGVVASNVGKLDVDTTMSTEKYGKHNLVRIQDKGQARSIAQHLGYPADTPVVYDVKSDTVVALNGEPTNKLVTMARGKAGVKNIVPKNTAISAELNRLINNPDNKVLSVRDKIATQKADGTWTLNANGEKKLLSVLDDKSYTFKSLLGEVNRGLKAEGNEPLTPNEFKDILKSQGTLADRAEKGFFRYDKGGTDYKGVFYDDNNVFNPHRLVEATGRMDIANNKDYMPINRALRESSLSNLADNILYDNPEKIDKVSAEAYKAKVMGPLQDIERKFWSIGAKAFNNGRGYIDGIAFRNWQRQCVEYANSENIAENIGKIWSEDVVKGGTLLKNWMSLQREFAQSWGKITGNKGKALIGDVLDNEFVRIVDDGKYSECLANYGSKEALIDVLTEYGKAFCKDDILTKRYGEDADKEQLAKLWAESIANGSNICNMLSDMNTAKNVNLEASFPVDTSGKLDTDKGVFCFDDMLRSFDLEQILPMQTKRLAGELALNASIPDVEALMNSTKDKALLVRALDDIKGIAKHDTVGDSIAKLLNTSTEEETVTGSIISMLGDVMSLPMQELPNVITERFPTLARYIVDVAMGKHDEILQETAKYTPMSDTLYMQMYGNSIGNNLKNYVDTFCDKGGINATATATSMVKMVQRQGLEDMLRYADGSTAGTVVTDNRLKLAGITDKNSYFASLKKYLPDNLETFKQEEPVKYAHLRVFADNLAKEVMLGEDYRKLVGVDNPMPKGAVWDCLVGISNAIATGTFNTIDSGMDAGIAFMFESIVNGAKRAHKGMSPEDIFLSGSYAVVPEDDYMRKQTSNADIYKAKVRATANKFDFNSKLYASEKVQAGVTAGRDFHQDLQDNITDRIPYLKLFSIVV